MSAICKKMQENHEKCFLHNYHLLTIFASTLCPLPCYNIAFVSGTRKRAPGITHTKGLASSYLKVLLTQKYRNTGSIFCILVYFKGNPFGV